MTPEYSLGQAMASIETSINWCRWGAGAQPGRYHLFSFGAGFGRGIDIGVFSAQCVVDDFGNLVAVPQ